MISLSSETILSIDALDELLWQLPRQEDDSGWKMLAEMRGLLDAYVTAEKLPYEEGEAKYTQNLGMRYFRHGDYEEALAAFEEAVEMWLDLGDELEQAKLIGYIGSCFWYLGYYGKALDSGAYLTKLCRIAIGDFKLEDAWELENLIKHIQEMEVVIEDEN